MNVKLSKTPPFTNPPNVVGKPRKDEIKSISKKYFVGLLLECKNRREN
jgi:hypothetical protein